MSMSSDQGDTGASGPRAGSTGTQREYNPQWWLWWPLTAVCIIELMLLGDVGLVTVAAMPAIQEDLHASLSDLQWVTGGYSLALASLLLTAGSLADRLGRKQVLQFGLVLFLLSQIGNAFAPNASVLIIFRLIEGVAGAAIFAVSLAVLSETYRGRNRGIAFGVWGAMASGSIAIGPILGGALVESMGWRSVFLIQIPLCLATIAITALRIERTPPELGRRIDWAGTTLFSLGLAAVVFALIRGGEIGWSSPVVMACGIAAVLLLTAFVMVERRVRAPMLELSRFRVPAFTAAQISAFTLSVSHFSLVFFLTLYLRRVHGYDALETGIRLLMLTAPAVLIAPFAGRLTSRISPRWPITVGIFLTGVGVLLLGLVEPGSSWTGMTAGFLLVGIGSGIFNPMLGFLAMGVVSRERAGMGSGISYTFRQLGLATGVALYGAIFAAEIHSTLGGLLPKLPPVALDGLSDAVSVGAFGALHGAAPPGQNAAFADAGVTSFVSGLDAVFVVAGIVALVISVLVAYLARNFVPANEGTRPGPPDVLLEARSPGGARKPAAAGDAGG